MQLLLLSSVVSERNEGRSYMHSSRDIHGIYGNVVVRQIDRGYSEKSVSTERSIVSRVREVSDVNWKQRLRELYYETFKPFFLSFQMPFFCRDDWHERWKYVYKIQKKIAHNCNLHSFKSLETFYAREIARLRDGKQRCIFRERMYLVKFRINGSTSLLRYAPYFLFFFSRVVRDVRED